jgi:hypothetical protein
MNLKLLVNLIKKWGCIFFLIPLFLSWWLGEKKQMKWLHSLANYYTGAFCQALCCRADCEGAASDACQQGTETEKNQFYSQVIAVYCCCWN